MDWGLMLRMTIGAFFGALGFAWLVHAPRRSWFVSGLIASFSFSLKGLVIRCARSFWGLLILVILFFMVPKISLFSVKCNRKRENFCVFYCGKFLKIVM